MMSRRQFFSRPVLRTGSWLCEATSEKSPTVGQFSELARARAKRPAEKSPTISSPNWLIDFTPNPLLLY